MTTQRQQRALEGTMDSCNQKEIIEPVTHANNEISVFKKEEVPQSCNLA